MEGLYEVAERRGAMALGGDSEGGEVLALVGVVLRRRKAVGDGGKSEVREAGEGGGAGVPHDAAVVELGVDEGDVETHGVEGLGEVEHAIDVALDRQREADCMKLGVGHGFDLPLKALTYYMHDMIWTTIIHLCR